MLLILVARSVSVLLDDVTGVVHAQVGLPEWTPVAFDHDLVASSIRPSSTSAVSTCCSDSSGVSTERVDHELGVLGHLVRRVGRHP